MSNGCNNIPTKLSTVDKCSGSVGNGQNLFNQWCEFDCPGTYQAFLYSLPNDKLGYNAENQQILQTSINNLFNTYFETNQITNIPGSSAYNSFQNNLLDLCLDPALPGVCDTTLKNYCGQFSRDQVLANNVLVDFCGCYTLPDQNYLKYSNDPSCDPICRRISTVQKADLANGEVKRCPENVCVINDVTINIINSEVKGGVNFSNICPACGVQSSADCLCIIAGTNVETTLSTIGAYDVKQFCGNKSVCLVEDPEGNIIKESNCDTLPNGPNLTNQNSFPNLYLVIFLIIIFVLIIIIIIAVKLFK